MDQNTEHEEVQNNETGIYSMKNKLKRNEVD